MPGDACAVQIGAIQILRDPVRRGDFVVCQFLAPTDAVAKWYEDGM